MDKKSIKIVITKEDIDYTLKPQFDFSDITNCPLAKVCKRILNENRITVGIVSFYNDKTKTTGDFKSPFNFEKYNELREGKIDKFETELILN